MGNNNNEKKFGTSVFDYIPEANKETIESEFFRDDEYDKDEINKMREEISYQNREPIKSIVSTDALSGMRAESIDDSNKDFDEIDENLKKFDIQGKSITMFAKSLIKSTMGRDATNEECEYISKKFEENSDTLKDSIDTDTIGPSISLNELETIIPEAIVNQIKGISGDEYERVLRRFIYQIYFSYSNTIAIRDDISELNKLGRKIKESELNTESSNEDVDKAVESMNDIYASMDNFLSITKNLDSRNKRMRQDYTIDDIEIRTVVEIKNCLNDAMTFKNVKEKVDGSINKFKKDVRRVEEMNNSIDSWINDIKNDSKILYTFPCNDFLTSAESREEIIKFLYNTYLANECQLAGINIGDIPIEEDLGEYLITNNIITDKQNLEFKAKARVMLYMISRTFKYKKVENNNLNIRRLSYTLDIISKLAVPDHMNAFIEASNYVYNKLTK